MNREIRAAGQRLIAQGLAEVICRIDWARPAASLITSADCVRMCARRSCRSRSKVGAGDSMVARHRYWVWRKAIELVDAARLGVAAGSAAVMTPGTQLCRREDAYRLYDEVSLS